MSLSMSPSQDSEISGSLSRSFPSSPSLVMDFPSMHGDHKVTEVTPLRLNLDDESCPNKRRREDGPITLLLKRSKHCYTAPLTLLPKKIPKDYFDNLCSTGYTGEACEAIQPKLEEEVKSFLHCLTPRRKQNNNSLLLSPPLRSSPQYDGEILSLDQSAKEKLLMPLIF
mmetsp:Transcript_11748/g.17234  ORF Transcript_11748/g.17234 Transcript_11748/m.17234 type:complete len:169 (+) Transcript_11748:270-776(+)|eukprot:CAMPEP_0194257440 /NCGR_PEP_ID=MMETSP0158-20130606/39054_1 /TAXON_ID=33649 /ORGANISM="Thalassionema nitzschioides, Strain L26-B" /LENGTH=168 /DNA_ID=CAMNT_0038996479 /DNA_START=168 /DNA_END=674 /DNA_ORIENTATION=-